MFEILFKYLPDVAQCDGFSWQVNLFNLLTKLKPDSTWKEFIKNLLADLISMHSIDRYFEHIIGKLNS